MLVHYNVRMLVISYFLSDHSDIDIRLWPDDNATSGIIELSIRDEWRSVCDDLWTNEDAIVACRQLGLAHTSRFSVLYVYVSLSKLNLQALKQFMIFPNPFTIPS